MTTKFGRNTFNQIFILTTDQLTDTNCTRMEHLFLPEIIISPKELAIGSAWLGENLIVHNNQVNTSIDRRIHGDRDFSFGSWKISNKMSVYFGRNADDKLE